MGGLMSRPFGVPTIANANSHCGQRSALNRWIWSAALSAVWCWLGISLIAKF
jgi:hypothetical protein